MNKINVGIVSKKENVEYSGYIEISEDLPSKNSVKCSYYLINQNDTGKVISGNFERQKHDCNFPNLMKELNLIVNGFGESHKT